MYEQPHLQNFVTHTHYPILERREHSYETSLTTTPRLLTSPDEGPEIYVLEATTEEGSSEDSVTFADLFYQDSDDHATALGPPGLHESMYEPARPETSFGVLPADDNMSIMSRGTTSTLLSLALSESDTLRSGLSEQEVYLLQWREHQIDLDDVESWADNLSDLVFETGGNNMVVTMQPQYEEEDDSWLLNILLDEEEDN